MPGPLRDAEQNQTPEEAITQGSRGNSINTQLTRREFLRLAALASSGMVFSTCAPSTQPPSGQTDRIANTPIPTAIKPAMGPTPTPQRIDSFDPQTGQMEFSTPQANERRIAVEDRFYSFLQNTDPFKSQYPNVPVVEFGVRTDDPNKPRFVFIYGDGKQPPVSPTLSPDKKFNVQVPGKLYYAVVDSTVENPSAVKFTKTDVEIPDAIPARTVYDPKTNRVEYIDAQNNSLGYVELSGERAGKINKPEKPETISAGEWSSRKEGGDTYHDASKAYQYVGSQNDEHAHLLDLQMGTLNVGVMTNKEEDLIALPLTLKRDGDNVSVLRDSKTLYTLKEKYGSMITNNQGEMIGVQDKIMAVRREIRNNYSWADEIDKNGYRNFIVIIETGAIAQVIRRTGKKDKYGDEILERYKIDEGGKLVDFGEFERYSKSPLEVKEGKLWRDNVPIQLSGAVVTAYGHGPAFTDPVRILNTKVKPDIDNILKMGGKFAYFQFNEDLAIKGGSVQMENFLQGLEYAKNRGLTTELAINFRGYSADLKGGIQIDNADINRTTVALRALFSDAGYAMRLAKSVDIFSPMAEPRWKEDGKTSTDWQHLTGIYNPAKQLIRMRIQNQNTIVALSPPDRATRVKELAEDQNFSLGKGDILEVHPYIGNDKSWGTINRTLEYLDALNKKGITILAGEIGWTDPVGKTSDTVTRVLNPLGIGYSYYPNADTINLVDPNTRDLMTILFRSLGYK